VVAGGVAGGLCFIGLTMLLHRRIFDPRIRLTSHRTDLAILVILWVQLCIGLSTLPASLHHVSDPQTMLRWPSYLQGIVLLAARRQPGGRRGLALPGAHAAGHDDLPAVPVQPPGACVERLRHGGYLFRPYQVVRHAG
jgi:nitrate reductase gamma subunit